MTVALLAASRRLRNPREFGAPAGTRTPTCSNISTRPTTSAPREDYPGMSPESLRRQVDRSPRRSFLASDEASFMPGTDVLDGGVLAKPYPAGEGA